MTRQDREWIVRRYFGCINDDEIDRLEGLLAAGELGDGTTRADLLDGYRGHHEEFADLAYDVRDLVVDGEQVVARVRFSGRHVGTFMGIEPTGNAVDFQAHYQFRVVEDTITAVTWSADTATVLNQLGHTMPATRAANEGTVGRLHEALDDGDYETVEAVLAREFVVLAEVGHPVLPYLSVADVVECCRRVGAAFPDLEVTVADTVVGDDDVVATLSVAGTFERGFGETEPTGERHRFETVSRYRVADGEIVGVANLGGLAALLERLDLTGIT